MATDFQFLRRSLISNEPKYTDSLEYRMFLAENPDFAKNMTLQPSLQNRNFQKQYNDADFQTAPSQLAATLDYRPRGSLLTGVNGVPASNNSQFVQYAPIFKQDPYEIQSQLPSAKTVASTVDLKPPTRASRVNRWEVKTIPNKGQDDLNDREANFNIDQAYNAYVDQGVAGLPTKGGTDPKVGVAPTAVGTHAIQQRQAVSVRPPNYARTSLISSAKMQLGGSGLTTPAGIDLPKGGLRPSATLHNTSIGPLSENPLVGYSEGERQRMIYKQEFMKFALSQAEGSINDVKERSRSKSRRARYEAAKQASLIDHENSLVDLMNRTKNLNNPNRLALKQRFAYSRAGSIVRAGSADLVRPGSVPNEGVTPYAQGDQYAGQEQHQNEGNPSVAQTPLPKVIDIGSEFGNRPDLLEQEQRKAEYKAHLFAQIHEKNEKKRIAKQREADDDQRLMNEYASMYRFGALRQGGGSPIRDKQGNIQTQHIPFSSQSQHNGGIEAREPNYVGDNAAYGQTFNDKQGFDVGGQTVKSLAGQTYSPKKQEIQHMKPSNMFEDITEEEFNKREQDKKAYQNELMVQMQEANERKRQDKERRQRQELEDEAKIHAALNQMNEAFRREENPNEGRSNAGSALDRVSQPSAVGQARSILKSRDPSTVSQVAPLSRQSQVNTNLPLGSPQPFTSVNVQPQPNYFDQPASSLGGETRNNSALREQLSRLQRVQDEIEAKNNRDRIETEQVFRDLIDSNRKLSDKMSVNNSQFLLNNLPQSINISVQQPPLSTNFEKSVSGNIRLESQFTQLPRSIETSMVSENKVFSATPIRESSNDARTSPLLGEASRSAAAETENKSAIGRLDDLIDDFSKPVANQGVSQL